MASDKPGFLEELKRRHVWRVAVAYAIAGWLIVQIATQVFPFFKIPDWGVRLVVILVVIGFPVAVVFAWVYELTPDGIRRTAPEDSPEARPEHTTRQIGRKLNAIIVAVLVLAVALLGWRLFAVRHSTAPAQSAEARVVAGATPQASSGGPPAAVASGLRTTNAAAPLPASTAAIPTKSVAVLPFANESGVKSEQFFSDGLSDDLITALSQFAGLKVISRNSAFQFRDSKDSSAKIGQLLGVAHLLEGSVQRAGDEVRITATLVNADDGSIVWSQRYDKPYRDLFALQDAITNAVAGALKAKLLTTNGAVVQSDRPPSGNLAAYTAYQQGVTFNADATEADEHKAIAAFALATRLDPHYARAYAALADTWARLGAFFLGGAAQRQAYDNAHNAVDKALQMDPKLAAGYVVRSYLETYGEFDWRSGLADAQQAVQLAPDDSNAKFQLAGVLATLGQLQRAAELTNAGLTTDPRYGSAYFDLSGYSSALGRLKDAEKAIKTAIAIHPQGAGYHEWLTIIEIRRGDAKAALAAAQHAPPGPWHEVAMALALQSEPNRAAANAALKKLIHDQADVSAYQIAQVYALRRDPDAMFKWLDRAWANRDPGVGNLLSDPLILRYRGDPRFAAFCKKVGLPTTTDAVAMK